MNEQDDRPDEEVASATESSTQPDPTQEPATSAGSIGFDFGDLVEDAKRVVTDPRGFYREMPRTGGLQRPLFFIIVMAVALALVTAIVRPELRSTIG